MTIFRSIAINLIAVSAGIYWVRSHFHHYSGNCSLGFVLGRRVGIAHVPPVYGNLSTETWAMPTLQDAEQGCPILVLGKRSILRICPDELS